MSDVITFRQNDIWEETFEMRVIPYFMAKYCMVVDCDNYARYECTFNHGIHRDYYGDFYPMEKVTIHLCKKCEESRYLDLKYHNECIIKVSLIDNK